MSPSRFGSLGTPLQSYYAMLSGTYASILMLYLYAVQRFANIIPHPSGPFNYLMSFFFKRLRLCCGSVVDLGAACHVVQ
jgi:hypothetical protein